MSPPIFFTPLPFFKKISPPDMPSPLQENLSALPSSPCPRKSPYPACRPARPPDMSSRHVMPVHTPHKDLTIPCTLLLCQPPCTPTHHTIPARLQKILHNVGVFWLFRVKNVWRQEGACCTPAASSIIPRIYCMHWNNLRKFTGYLIL